MAGWSTPLPTRLPRRSLLSAGFAATAVSLWRDRPRLTAATALAQRPPTETLVVAGNRPEWQPAMDDLLAASGLDAAYQAVAGTDYLALVQSVQAGAPVADVFGFPEGASIREALEQIVALTDRVPVDRLLPSVRTQVDFEGGVWGCPLAAYTVAVYYRPEVFAAHALDVPTTWDAFRAVCDTLLAAGISPVMLPTADAVAPYYWYCLAATSILGAVGWPEFMAGQRRLTDEPLPEAARLLQELMRFAAPGATATDYAAGRARFAAGEGAMFLGTSADLAHLGSVDPSNPMPNPSAFGFPAYTDGPPTTLTGVEIIFAVLGSSLLVESARELVGWLLSDEAQAIVAEQIGLPVLADVAPAASSNGFGVVQSGADFPVWHAVPPLTETFAATTTLVGALLDGSLPPEEFAVALQAAIDDCRTCQTTV